MFMNLPHIWLVQFSFSYAICDIIFSAKRQFCVQELQPLNIPLFLQRYSSCLTIYDLGRTMAAACMLPTENCVRRSVSNWDEKMSSRGKTRHSNTVQHAAHCHYVFDIMPSKDTPSVMQIMSLHRSHVQMLFIMVMILIILTNARTIAVVEGLGRMSALLVPLF